MPSVSHRPEKSEIIDWLNATARLGSDRALKDLEKLDRESYKGAWTSWTQRFCESDNATGVLVPSERELILQISNSSNDDIPSVELNDRGHGFIHVAASLDYAEALQVLLNRGANVDSSNRKGENALFCACRAGHASLALKLLSHGAHVEPADSGETPLHWLIACDDADVDNLATMLLTHGANLEAHHTFTEENDFPFDVYPHGTPLDWAVAQRKTHAITVLINIGADPFNDCSEYSAFVRAVSLHDVEVLNLLLKSRHATRDRVKALDSTGQSLLFHGVYCNSPSARILQHGDQIMQAFCDTIDILLDNGCDPSFIQKEGDTIMHLAAGFTDREYLELLMDRFHFIKYINYACGELSRTPLHQAIASCKLEIVKLLLSRGANTHCVSQGRTLLHMLASIEDERHAVDCLELIDLSTRDDLDVLTPHTEVDLRLTAFELAVYGGKLRVAELLLSHGANPNGPRDRDPHFLSILIADGSWFSSSALQFYLEKARPDFVMKPSSQLTALHIAASMFNLLAESFTAELKLDILLRFFSNPDQINAKTMPCSGLEVSGGQTPLHYAAKFGVCFAVKRLLEVGGDPTAFDDDEHSPLDLAQSQLHLIRKSLLFPDEIPRGVSDFQDAIGLLEAVIDGRPLPTSMRRPSFGEKTRARFSHLGFHTEIQGNTT